MKVICAIKDNAIDAFEKIFEVRATGEAMRLFMNEINNTQSNIHIHASDFELYKLATFDETTGIIEVVTPERLARAIDLKGTQS